jgi:hypothetical protein
VRIQLYVDLCKWAAEQYGGAVDKPVVSAFLMNVLISADKNGGGRLTPAQRTALSLAVRIAREQYRDHVKTMRREPGGERIAAQFERQEAEAAELEQWLEDPMEVRITL